MIEAGPMEPLVFVRKREADPDGLATAEQLASQLRAFLEARAADSGDGSSARIRALDIVGRAKLCALNAGGLDVYESAYVGELQRDRDAARDEARQLREAWEYERDGRLEVRDRLDARDNEGFIDFIERLARERDVARAELELARDLLRCQQARADRIDRERDEAREEAERQRSRRSESDDCEQHGVCATAPGCARHFGEEIEALRARADRLEAEADRWARRVRLLERRLARIRETAEGR